MYIDNKKSKDNIQLINISQNLNILSKKYYEISFD